MIDGPDGAGKSTQVDMLAEHLCSVGESVITVRDPGSTEIGEAVRQILLSPAHDKMTIGTELLLYTAARVQLYSEKIAPALRAGSWVISDRWIYSSCTYQGMAGDMGSDLVEEVNQTVGLKWADKAIILDVDAAVGLARLSGEPDRMESKPLAFHKAVREGYLALAKVRPEVSVVDASGDIEQTQRAIRQVLGV